MADAPTVCSSSGSRARRNSALLESLRRYHDELLASGTTNAHDGQTTQMTKAPEASVFAAWRDFEPERDLLQETYPPGKYLFIQLQTCPESSHDTEETEQINRHLKGALYLYRACCMIIWNDECKAFRLTFDNRNDKNDDFFFPVD